MYKNDTVKTEKLFFQFMISKQGSYDITAITDKVPLKTGHNSLPSNARVNSEYMSPIVVSNNY